MTRGRAFKTSLLKYFILCEVRTFVLCKVKVLEVKRVSERMMSMMLEIKDVMMNPVSAYALQTGRGMEEKRRILESAG